MKSYKGLLIEFKKAVFGWICDNADNFQIINACVENFKRYIYDENGNYLIGGEVRYNFIADACALLTA